ncbi:MAG: SPOR domain-containing protein [Amaricoccus sp.]|uniref:SPOR domain-containing protein n=1 Tax=Amaricoccus sp. TaxID=1872485 RepID=UPI0039E2E18D
MRDLYSDDFESVAADGADRLIPEGMRRVTGAIVFVGVIVVMGVWAWRLGTRDASEVPIIRAMEGPSRLQPSDPGGLQAAHQGLEVNAVLGGAPEHSKAAAVPPARPTPPALQAEDAPQGELVASAPQALTEKVMGQVTAGLAEPDEGEAGVQPILPPDVTSEEDEATLGGASEMADAEAAADAAPTTDMRPRNRPAGLQVARAAAVAAPAATDVAAAARPAAAKPADARPADVRPAAASPKAVATSEVGSVQAGSRLVQLGAFDSEDITRKAWSSLVAKNPDLLASKSLYVERTTSNARVFYRLRVAGFQSADDTRRICEALRGRGVACIPVTLQ